MGLAARSFVGWPDCEREGFRLSVVLPLVNSSRFWFGTLGVLLMEGERLGPCAEQCLALRHVAQPVLPRMNGK